MQQTHKLSLQFANNPAQVPEEWGWSLFSLQACFALSGSNKEPSNLTHEWNPICFSLLSVASAQFNAHTFSLALFRSWKQSEALEGGCLNKPKLSPFLAMAAWCGLSSKSDSMLVVSLIDLFLLKPFSWLLHLLCCVIWDVTAVKNPSGTITRVNTQVWLPCWSFRCSRWLWVGARFRLTRVIIQPWRWSDKAPIMPHRLLCVDTQGDCPRKGLTMFEGDACQLRQIQCLQRWLYEQAWDKIFVALWP